MAAPCRNSPRIRASRTCCSSAAARGGAAGRGTGGAAVGSRPVARGRRAASATATCARDSELHAARVAIVDRGALERVRRTQRTFEQLLGDRRSRERCGADVEQAGVLLALAYPDRVGRRRPGGEGALPARERPRRACSQAPSPSRAQEFIVAVDLDDREREARIRLAIAARQGGAAGNISPAELRARRRAGVGRDAPRRWSRGASSDSANCSSKKSRSTDVPREASAAAMLERCAFAGSRALPWDDEARDFLARARVRARRWAAATWPIGRTSRATRWRADLALARAVPRRHHAPLAARARAAARCAARAARVMSSSAGSTSSRRPTSRCPRARARASTTSTTTRPWPRCACRKCSAWPRRRASAAAPCP